MLLIGRQETYYDPLAALERGTRLVPIIEAELIPQACHEFPISKPETVNPRILTFLEAQPRLNVPDVHDLLTPQQTSAGLSASGVA